MHLFSSYRAQLTNQRCLEFDLTITLLSQSNQICIQSLVSLAPPFDPDWDLYSNSISHYLYSSFISHELYYFIQNYTYVNIVQFQLYRSQSLPQNYIYVNIMRYSLFSTSCFFCFPFILVICWEWFTLHNVTTSMLAHMTHLNMSPLIDPCIIFFIHLTPILSHYEQIMRYSIFSTSCLLCFSFNSSHKLRMIHPLQCMPFTMMCKKC